MNVQLLIDSIVRQTTVLVAQLATAGGVRAPLASVANQVFLDLADELNAQGVSRRVSADMFGLALRTYLRKIQRLRESSTDSGKSLWEAILEHLGTGQLVTRGEVLRRFHRDDPDIVRGVLHDLSESGLVMRVGSGANTAYRAVTKDELLALAGARDTDGTDELVWAIVYREGPIAHDALVKLVRHANVDAGRRRRSCTSAPPDVSLRGRPRTTRTVEDSAGSRGAGTMKRSELEHVIRAASTIADDDEIVNIGSQSILGQFPSAPAELCVSNEADVYPKNHPDRAELIDGSIGELSPFHETFGYYARGVGENTAVLPDGWQTRLIPIRTPATRGVVGLCLEVHDLLVSKYVAGREKDRRFARDAIRHALVTESMLLDRLSNTPIDDALRERLTAFVVADFAA